MAKLSDIQKGEGVGRMPVYWLDLKKSLFSVLINYKILE